MSLILPSYSWSHLLVYFFLVQKLALSVLCPRGWLAKFATERGRGRERVLITDTPELPNTRTLQEDTVLQRGHFYVHFLLLIHKSTSSFNYHSTFPIPSSLV